MGRRLTNVRCVKGQPGESWDRHGHGRPGWEDGTTVIDLAEDPNDQLLALCLSCRVIYTEAIPFLYSTPLFAILDAAYFFDSSSTSLGTLVHIQNLHLDIRFFRFPQDGDYSSTPHDMANWSRICRDIAALTSLRYPCITISQLHFDFELRSEDENARLVDELPSPLKSIRVKAGGKFDIVTEGWKVPRELNYDLSN